MNVNKIGILFHPKVEATIAKAREVEEFLKSRKLAVWVRSAWEPADISSSLDGTDFIVTVGGDGTILRAVHAVGDTGVPVTGVNLGKLGFLAELDASDTLEQLDILINGGGWIDERAMLHVDLVSAERGPQEFYALNDVTVGRGDVIRLVKIDLAIDDRYIATYRADAAVIATATGSTGYALAAGGPVMYPGSRDMVVIPVAAHLGMPYPLIVPSTSKVGLTVNTYHAASLSIDGHDNLSLSDGDTVTVGLSSRTARLLRFRPKDFFFCELEEKLRGKHDKR